MGKELGGKKLTTAKTSGSVSNRVGIWLCPSGKYAMQKQFSGFSTGGGTLSMADENVEYGCWRVESGVLILQPENSKTQRYEISQETDESVFELNGNGYLVTSHNECR